MEQEVCGEPLLEAVLLYAVRLRGALRFLLLLLSAFFEVYAVLAEDLAVCFFCVDTVEAGPEGGEVAAYVLGEAVPFAGCEIYGEAVVSVVVEGAAPGEVAA